MVFVIATRMEDQAIVEKLYVAGAEIHVQANSIAAGDFLQNPDGPPFGIAERRTLGCSLPYSDR